MTTRWDVIVVGGGLAGLTAAATAAQAGATTLVLDAARGGGRARTTDKDGFVFNHGAHALYRGGEGYAILRTLGVEPRGPKPPLARYKLLMDGGLHRMPASASSLLRTTAVGTRGKAQLAKVLATLPRVDASAQASVSADDWIADLGLRRDAERVLRALMRIASYGDDFSTLSAQVPILQLQRSIRAGVLYLDAGWAQVIGGLARHVQLRSGSVRSVGHDGTDVVVETADERHVGRAVVVAAGSPPAAAGVIGSDPGWGDLGPPVTAACLDVAARRVPSPGYVLGVDVPVYATTQSPPARQAPEGGAVVAVLRYGARSADEDRAELGAWLEHVGVRPDDVVHQRFLARLNVTAAAPLARLGGLAGRPAIDHTGMRNVFLAGDWVGGDGCLADASFASGHAAGLAAVRGSQRSATMFV